jgi:hypothetical protein
MTIREYTYLDFTEPTGCHPARWLLTRLLTAGAAPQGTLTNSRR